MISHLTVYRECCWRSVLFWLIIFCFVFFACTSFCFWQNSSCILASGLIHSIQSYYVQLQKVVRLFCCCFFHVFFVVWMTMRLEGQEGPSRKLLLQKEMKELLLRWRQWWHGSWRSFKKEEVIIQRSQTGDEVRRQLLACIVWLMSVSRVFEVVVYRQLVACGWC